MTATQPLTTATAPVLIVGAGPAGLVTALGLARQGIDSILVERHAGTSIFPRATAISVRSMEILRGLGLEPAIRAFSLEAKSVMSASRTLAEPDHVEVPLGFPSADEAFAVSPTRGAISPQDHVEPLLVERLRALGRTELRFDTELQSLEQDGNGVTARLVDRRTGAPIAIQARYVVGADGGRSTVRDLLGIGTIGAVGLQHHAAMLFRADLWSILGERRYGLYTVAGPDGGSIFAPQGPDDRWVFAMPSPLEDVEAMAADPDRAIALIRAAAGAPDLAVELLAVMPLTFSAELATRWRDRRVFLIGDAAHRMPPYGGRGMNTAIADAHNLAWKLAWVIGGIAGPALLDSYEAERGPVGRRNIALALARFPERLATSGVLEALPPGTDLESTPDGLAEDVGYTYASGSILADPAPDAAGPAVAAMPGGRVPHAWLALDGRRISTVDLVDQGLALFVAGSGGAWRRAARQVNPAWSWFVLMGATGPALPLPPTAPITVHAVGRGLTDPDGAFAAAFGLADGGAVLVRPDGHVAVRWATAPANHRSALAEAVAIATGQGPARKAAAPAPQPDLAGRPLPGVSARPAV